MKIDKTYLISGLSVLMAASFYGYTKYKNKKTEAKYQNQPDVSIQVEEEVLQTEIPSNLASILSKSLTQINLQLKGKSIGTKLSNVNARSSAKVNDGFFNNSYGPIPTKNTFVGKVISVVEDINKAKNSSGKVFKWIKVRLSEEAIAELNTIPKSFSYYTPSFGGDYTAYFREDTIILK